MVRREKSNYIIQSVSHALDVLEQFCRDGDEIGVTELSKRLKLHKNNVFRLLATLEARGYIEQNKVTENYRLGLRCLQLGRAYVHQTGFLLQASSMLKDLAKAAMESCFVAVRRGSSVVPLDFREPESPVRVVSFLGRALPLHCTAAGKVHLAFESEEVLSQNLPEDLERYTARTVTDRQLLLGELKEVSQAGFALEQGEFMDEVVSVAAPVRDYTRTLVGSVAMTGPAHRLTKERIGKEMVPLILKVSGELSRRLGYQE